MRGSGAGLFGSGGSTKRFRNSKRVCSPRERVDPTRLADWEAQDQIVHSRRYSRQEKSVSHERAAVARRGGEKRRLGGGGGDGGARPDLALLTSFSPVFFFSRVIKSGVSVGGARVGRGARRGDSRW
jgi:hypothetical protein